MKNEEFNTNYERIKEKYEKIVDNGNSNLLDQIFIHEIGGNFIHVIEGYRYLLENKIVEERDYQEIINALTPTLEKILLIEPILNIKDFKKEQLRSENENKLYDYLVAEQKNIKHLYNVDMQILGNKDVSSKINEGALCTMISTNIGDAIKWSPKGKEIVADLNEEGKYNILTIKNEFEHEPANPEIGFGHGVGSAYTKLFMDSIGGKINESVTGSIYKKEFYIPKYLE